MEQHAIDVVVIGGGPGGYTAAFRLADLGKKVMLVENSPNLGGVCLNVGCIPSKTLLNVVEKISAIQDMKKFGINCSYDGVDLHKLREFKQNVINNLNQGLKGLSAKRKVQIKQGIAKFHSNNQIIVNGEIITFNNAIIATGSRPIMLPNLPHDPRIMDSTRALELASIPKELLIIGAGIIGMELGTVYACLGSNVTVVELTDTVLPGVDAELLKIFQALNSKTFSKIMLSTKVNNVKATNEGLLVEFAKQQELFAMRFDSILVAIGRIPNTQGLDLQAIGVACDQRGFISVDSQMRTANSNVFAIGDIVSGPMLAHKAIPQAKIAAEVIAGHNYHFQPQCIPNVAYTKPEIAWVGMTEKELKEKNIPYIVGKFPWAASGRALSMAETSGMTKICADPKTHRILSASIIGMHAGDLISEMVLAIEMSATLEDLALTIHPHPTIAETMSQSAEMALGTITDLFIG